MWGSFIFYFIFFPLYDLRIDIGGVWIPFGVHIPSINSTFKRKEKKNDFISNYFRGKSKWRYCAIKSKKPIFKSFVFQECSSQFFSSIGSYITTKTYVLCGLSTGQIVYTIQLETLCGQLRFEQPLEKNQTRTRSNWSFWYFTHLHSPSIRYICKESQFRRWASEIWLPNPRVCSLVQTENS